MLLLTDVFRDPSHQLVAPIVHRLTQQHVENFHSVKISSRVLKLNARDLDAQPYLAHLPQLVKMLDFANLAVPLLHVVKIVHNRIAMSAVITLTVYPVMCALKPFATIRDAKQTSAQLVKTLAGVSMGAK